MKVFEKLLSTTDKQMNMLLTSAGVIVSVGAGEHFWFYEYKWEDIKTVRFTHTHSMTLKFINQKEIIATTFQYIHLQLNDKQISKAIQDFLFYELGMEDTGFFKMFRYLPFLNVFHPPSIQGDSFDPPAVRNITFKSFARTRIHSFELSMDKHPDTMVNPHRRNPQDDKDVQKNWDNHHTHLASLINTQHSQN